MNQDDKKLFRRQMLAKRDALPFEKRIEADFARNERIRNWDVYKEAELLLFYVNYRSEADTMRLIKEALQEGRKVAVPRVIGSDMVFYRIGSELQLVEGYKGILEPGTEQTEAIVGSGVSTSTEVGEVGNIVVPIESMTKDSLPKRTILFVPGCAFDEKGGRMGYGGGFYDRFMEQYPEILRVALAYEEQLVSNVPREVHDKSVDVIVTEARLVQVSKKD